MKLCSNCGTENDDANMFCGKCGASLKMPEPAPAPPKEPEKKVCPGCGMENDGANMFCGKCGASLKVSEPAPAPPKEPDKKRCPNCGMVNDSTYMFCENCGTSLRAPASQPAASGNATATPGQFSSPPPAASFSMGWHKFLIYFALWAGALMNVSTGLSTLGNDALYSRIDGLESLNGFYCLALPPFF